MVSRDRGLRRSQDFDSARSRGKRAGNSILLVTSAPNDLDHMRFGLAVGKRVGNATVRNTVKRRIRESIRLLDVSGSSDIIVSARPDAATADYSAIQASLASLLTRLGITSKPKRN